MAVDSIQAENFFFSQEDIEAKKEFASEVVDKDAAKKEGEAHQTRQEMLQMGNSLVDLTD